MIKSKKLFLLGILLILLGCYVSHDSIYMVRFNLWEHTIWNWWTLVAGSVTCGWGLKEIRNSLD